MKARKKTKKEKRAKRSLQPKNMVVALGDGTWYCFGLHGRGGPREDAALLGRADAESIVQMAKRYGFRSAYAEAAN